MEEIAQELDMSVEEVKQAMNKTDEPRKILMKLLLKTKRKMLRPRKAHYEDV